jgi:hypothetical protein
VFQEPLAFKTRRVFIPDEDKKLKLATQGLVREANCGFRLKT